MNLGEIRETIRAYGYATDTDAAQNMLINAVYREVLADRRWPWLLRQAPVTLPAGGNQVTIASITNLRDVEGVRVPGHEDPSFATPANLRSWISQYPHTRGRPELWTRVGATLEVYPTADRDYELLVDYIYSPPPLTSDQDEPVIPIEHQDILVHGVVARLGMRERDVNTRQLMMDAYSLSLQSLRAAAGFTHRQGSNQVAQSGFFREV